MAKIEKYVIEAENNEIVINDETFVRFSKKPATEDDAAAQLVYALAIHLNYEPAYLLELTKTKLVNGELN